MPYLALKEDPNDSLKQIPYLEDRQTLTRWASKMIESDKMTAYRAENNSRSLDGLPGLKAARRDAGERLWINDWQARVQRPGGVLYTISVAMVSILSTVIFMHLLGFIKPTSFA